VLKKKNTHQNTEERIFRATLTIKDNKATATRGDRRTQQAQ
jgi:hypothetical protein